MSQLSTQITAAVSTGMSSAMGAGSAAIARPLGFVKVFLFTCTFLQSCTTMLALGLFSKMMG